MHSANVCNIFLEMALFYFGMRLKRVHRLLVYDLAKWRSNIFRDPLNFRENRKSIRKFSFKVKVIIITPYMACIVCNVLGSSSMQPLTR